jgi:hypothetical protein
MRKLGVEARFEAESNNGNHKNDRLPKRAPSGAHCVLTLGARLPQIRQMYDIAPYVWRLRVVAILRPPGALTPHISTPRRSNPGRERQMRGPLDIFLKQMRRPSGYCIV